MYVRLKEFSEVASIFCSTLSCGWNRKLLWPLTEHGMAEIVHEQQGVEDIPLDILQNTKYLKEMCNSVVKRLDGFQFLYLKLRYGNLT